MITYKFTSQTFSGQTVHVQYSKYSSNTRLDLGSGTFPFQYTTDQLAGTYYFYIPIIDRTFSKIIEIPAIDIYTEEIKVPDCDISGSTTNIPDCDIDYGLVEVPVCDIDYNLEFIKPTQTPTITPTPTIPGCRCYNISNSGPNSFYTARKCNESSSSENQILANTSQQKCFIEGSFVGTQTITAVPTTLCNNCGGGVFSCGTCPTPTPTQTMTLTPTSSPEAPIVVPLCSVIYNAGSNVYYYDVTTNTKTLLNVPPAPVFAGADISHTENHIWMSSWNKINEWDITLSPFSATYIRQISLPYEIGPGLGAINDTTLIAVGNITEPKKVILLDITNDTAVPTYLFDTLPNRMTSGDIIYTTTDKVIITNHDTTTPSDVEYVTQYNFSTGEVEVDILISPFVSNPYGIFVDNDEFFIARSNGNIYHIDKNPPYTITLTGDTDTQIAGASQLPNCINTNFNF
jgi:hypothetical protein